MKFIGKYLKGHWIRLTVCFVIGIAIMIIYNSSNDGFNYIVYYSNGAFIAGGVLFCVGLLTVVNYFGGLDIFSYMFNKHPNPQGNRESLYEYSERKKVERKPSALVFIDYFIIGAIFMIVALSTLLAM